MVIAIFLALAIVGVIALAGAIWAFILEGRLQRYGMSLSDFEQPEDERTRLLREIHREQKKHRPHLNFRR